jgi:TRAP-type C4-dicarboxylate transport system permease small subunit
LNERFAAPAPDDAPLRPPRRQESARPAGMMLRYRRVVFWLDVIAAAMFCTMFAAIIAQTTMRYLFRSPLAHSLEFATIAFIWLVFWVASCNLAINDHIRFDIVYNLLPDSIRRLFGVITNLTFAVIFVLAAPATWDYLVFLQTQYTASMTISYMWAFFTYFIFFAILPVKILNVVALLSPRWQERI